MSDKLEVKIHVPDMQGGELVRTEKRLRPDAEYLNPGWRVLGVPFGVQFRGVTWTVKRSLTRPIFG